MAATKLRDTIITAIEMSKDSKIPVLFFSNPGYAKTTTINNYAKKNGYHVETLIGSHYSQDEILGFQANTGKDHLEILEPEWFHRVMEKKAEGVPSILFLDELSTVSGPTQGALLQLCFERKIRGGKTLPEDCIVISAANYKNNLPDYSEIIAPELNRFCIVNLLPENPYEVVSEFCGGETLENWPEFKSAKLDSETEANINNDVEQSFIELFNAYSYKSVNGRLDIQNTNYDGIYDRPESCPEVLNFISGRSMSYMQRTIKSLVKIGLKRDNPNNYNITNKFIDGLIGLGTNSWDDDEEAYAAQLGLFRKKIHASFGDIIAKYSSSAVEEKEEEVLDIYGCDIPGKVQKFMSEADKSDGSIKSVFTSEMLVDIYSSANKKYKDIIKAMEEIEKGNETVSSFLADYDSLSLVASFLIDRKNSRDDAAMAASIYGVRIKQLVSNMKSYREMAKANVSHSDIEM